MKMRIAFIAVLAVFVMVLSSAVVASSDSDAAVDCQKYYYNQLDADQQAVYDAYVSNITGDPTGSPGAYQYVIASTASQDDAVKAWEACRLDNPYAFWTWTSGYGVPAIVADGSNITIPMEDRFATASAMAAQAKVKIDAVSLDGKKESTRLESILDAIDDMDVKFEMDGASGIYGILAGDDAKLSAMGFAALFKALCDRSVDGVSVGCMQVYGTHFDGDEGEVWAWNTVIVDGRVYASDIAVCIDEDTDAWLCAGAYTVLGSDAFSKAHRAFDFNSWAGMTSYKAFDSELIGNDGYDWPEEDKSVVEIIIDFAPWIVTGLICIILAVALFIMAKKEGRA